MTISQAGIKLFKSETVSDTPANGGRAGNIEVVSGVRHALLPRITEEQRAAGYELYRKFFVANVNAANEVGNDALDFVSFPTTGGDRVYLGVGTQTDTQGDIVATPPEWVGCGQLNAPLSGGETAIQLLMPHNDYSFIAGGKLFLSNGYRTGQTIGVGVRVGDTVEDVAGAWISRAASNNTVYPFGRYLGGNIVKTFESGVDNAEYLTVDSFAYAGNVATVQLAGAVSGAYAPANTYGAQCIETAEIAPAYDNLALTSTSGAFDDVGSLELTNRGTTEDVITLQMTTASAFSCSGLYAGSLGTGTVSIDFAPVNTAAGDPFFTIRSAAWGGTLAAGDQLVFHTHPARLPRWVKNVAPAGVSAENDNLFNYDIRVQ